MDGWRMLCKKLSANRARLINTHQDPLFCIGALVCNETLPFANCEKSGRIGEPFRFSDAGYITVGSDSNR
jgi:hypothetical protein